MKNSEKPMRNYEKPMKNQRRQWSSSSRPSVCSKDAKAQESKADQLAGEAADEAVTAVPLTAATGATGFAFADFTAPGVGPQEP